MAALYLRGVPGGWADRRRWPFALTAMQAAGGATRRALVAALHEAGLQDEATAVGCTLRWGHASDAIEKGAAIAVSAENFPARLLRVLGVGAPAAVWSNGSSIPAGVRYAAVVGTREPDDDQGGAADSVTTRLIEAGYVPVSGGAKGVDQVARMTSLGCGSPWLEWLPCGPIALGGRGWSLSVNASGTPFGTASAMERNALIYASAEFAVVIGPRFREGGTWHGACAALRRRLCPVLVLQEETNLATRALVALGAIPLFPGECPVEVLASRGPSQKPLPLAEPW